MTVKFDNSYAKLPERFYARQSPVPVAHPDLIRVNRPLAEFLGIDPDWLESDTGIEMIAGNQLPSGAEPVATVYAGHQFGNWNPRLGDGRAILLGEVIAADGERYDIQLKGSGLTPFSRGGDGRAPLGPVIREYIVSEAMAALDIPTSRTLAAVTTGEYVYREQKLAGGVLARVARSHIRIGTLQYFASVNDTDGLKLLIDHVLARHYPDQAGADNPALALLEQVIHSQASLLARWQSVGFIHGVMNTDNMLLSGETIDYGPCAFMDSYDSAALYSSIDHAGRYAYRNQPPIAHWNLACLAQTLVPLLAAEEEAASDIAQQALGKFPALFLDSYQAILNRKLGLVTMEKGDAALAQAFLDLLEANRCDFTLAFRRLSELADGRAIIQPLFDFPESFTDWLAGWQARCERESISATDRHQQMMTTNPALIPRNHLVEAAIAGAYDDDLSLFHQLTDRLSAPFDYAPGDEYFATPPEPEQVVQQTFCGT